MLSARDYIKEFSTVRTLPHVVTKLMKLIDDSNATMKDFESVIKMDPILVIRLLRIVNSPFYGLRQSVDSIGRAVAFLGMKNLRNMAVTDAMKSIFEEKPASPSFSRKRLWLHSAAVSICSKMLAERIFGVNGDDAYLCGILHDFGLIVEEQVAGNDFIRACEACDSKRPLPEVEQEFLGTDHCEIGYLLTHEWGIAEPIQVAIKHHHSIDDSLEPDSLTGIIQLAEYIIGKFGYGALPCAVATELSPPLASHIEDNIEEYEILLEDFPEEMDKAKDIYDSAEI